MRVFLNYILIGIFIVTAFSDTNPAEKNLNDFRGELLSVDYEGPMLPEEIDEFNAQLFEGSRAPEAMFTVDIYWVTYKSKYPDGSEAPITSQFFIPRYSDQESRSVYIFGSGSTGLRDSCRPSREHIAGIRWGLYRSHVLAHAGQGSIGIMPDYMGFGDPDQLQYYMVAELEARVLLDAARAFSNLVSRIRPAGIDGLAYFTGGFSQGGHASFAAADYNNEYLPEIELDGVIGYGPTTDLFNLFREYPDVAPMALFTYRELYGVHMVDPNKILNKKYAQSLDRDIQRMCVGAMQSYYPINPDLLFTAQFRDALINNKIAKRYPNVFTVLKRNSTGLTGHRIPALILQGTDDIVVYKKTQDTFVDALRRSGSQVDYRVLQNSRHDTRQDGFFIAREWMNRITEQKFSKHRSEI